ncbi:MAG: glutamate synthase large subunit [Candidatus Kuenenia sp.]|nr:glutamate synthase large subunit [Candidatus Kuenenia hertensis]
MAGFPGAHGLYDPKNERDGCGVGFVAQIDGIPSHTIVKNAIQALINLEHRGAVGSDKCTGDGSGLLLQIPDDFFRQVYPEQGILLPQSGKYGVGMLYLPQAESMREKCKRAVEEIMKAENCIPLGWRKVPVNSKCLGELSRSTQPEIYQIFVKNDTLEGDDFERKLYIIRRCIEKEIASWTSGDYSQFYICSFSHKTIVYKGLLTGSQLPSFFPDLVDPRFCSPYAIIHQRYSTNTLPTWNLAQPFRCLAHNGEINTLRGNINQMKAREKNLKSDLFGDDIEKIKPVIQNEYGSDSSIFDNVFELLVNAGRSLAHAAMMMVPEACGKKYYMSDDKRSFYEFHASFMEPWDGPAAIVITDGRYIGAMLDRNGLRPARYTITKDGMIIMASETGVLDIAGEDIRYRGRLQPGKMLLVDLQQARIVPDNEIKAKVSRQSPYRRWLKENLIELRGLLDPSELPEIDPNTLHIQQHAFGYTDEDINVLISPMASRGQEPIGAMGNDTSLAVLSDKPQLLFHYFKQLFAQVTNPPIDPLREELVMSLMNFMGKKQGLLGESPKHCMQIKLPHPILTPTDMWRIRNANHPDLTVREIDILFPPKGGGAALQAAMVGLFEKAEKCIAEGANILILTDTAMDKDHCPIPALLAVSGLHHHLINKGLRNECGLIIETGEAREVMHFSLLIAFGVTAICPHVAFSSVMELAEQGLLEVNRRPEEAMDNYISAIKKGLLKTFSRMGISTIRSFFGSQIFEAIGIDESVINTYFCNTASRLSGIGLEEMAQEVYTRHRNAFPLTGSPNEFLEIGGRFSVKYGGEKHLWNPETIYKLQHATRTGDYEIFKEYTRLIDDQTKELATLRGLFGFKNCVPIPIDEVEPIEKITRRFVTAAMSFGSISKETHESIAIAMNRIGGRSNSGEGGEDPVRYKILPNSDRKISKIKQVASGRFGVTSEYLLNAEELQIKIAQGAKPGEGGQLPGHKVSSEIAKVRHTTPGVSLISPPPHHDIYSIEDLKQIIYDLHSANPKAKVSVKLVSAVGVGTVAAGVAKAKADLVLISGYDGGTGAAPWSSIMHAGVPWELGLAETQQTLVANGLRDRIVVQTDGQLKTGRDVVIAALLGAEEFGFGTTVLVTLGCVMMRKCHLNTCPVGVATQDPFLRTKFSGQAEYVECFFRFIAQEVREYMAALGFRTIDEMIGRVDKIEVKNAASYWKAKHLDFTALLTHPAPGNSTSLRCIRNQNHELSLSLDNQLIKLAENTLIRREPVVINLPIRNINRSVGTMLSSEITKKYGASGLPEDTIRLNFKGSAGQSLGAFLVPGVTIHVEGDANDYVGKGMCGGKIIVNPPGNAAFKPHENIIAGNVILYGATSGELYLHGMAGERFAVRNSGATAVVEGVGDHGCEYMTGGTVVVIGQTGVNFGAGMSGGVAYVYDEHEWFGMKCNLDMVDLESVWAKEDSEILRILLEKHHEYTQSERAKDILNNWESRLPLFVKVMPMEYKKSLERIRQEEHVDDETVTATEEVYRG